MQHYRRTTQRTIAIDGCVRAELNYCPRLFRKASRLVWREYCHRGQLIAVYRTLFAESFGATQVMAVIIISIFTRARMVKPRGVLLIPIYGAMNAFFKLNLSATNRILAGFLSCPERSGGRALAGLLRTASSDSGLPRCLSMVRTIFRLGWGAPAETL